MKKIFKKIKILIPTILLVLGILMTVGCQPISTTKLDEIQKSGKIILGTSADYPPYEFIKMQDGKEEYVGFDIDIAQGIADKLGVELEIKNMSFDGLLPALQTGTVDFVLAGMQATDERKEAVDFSTPYHVEKNVVLVKAENASKYTTVTDLAGKKIGAQLATTQEKAANMIEGAELVILQNLLDLVQQVKSGMIDGLIISNMSGGSHIAADSSLAFAKNVIVPYEQEGTAVAIAKGNPELLAEIQDALDEMIANNDIEQFVLAAQKLSLQADENGIIQSEVDLITEEKVDDTNSITPAQRGTFDFLLTYYPLLITGIKNTLLVALFSVAIGSVGGILLAILKLSKNKILSTIATIYIDFIRGTPLLIQLYIVAFGLPTIGIRLPALLCGVIALSLNCFAYIAEIIRAGINAVDKGQMEAARSIGMSESLAMKEIILPQAIKNILPALGNEFITIIKESSIVSVTGVMELMFAANTIRGNTFQAFAPLIVTSIIYFLITFVVSKILLLLEGKLNTDAN